MAVGGLVLGVVAAWLAVAAGEEMRTWSDSSGKFKIKATFLELRNEKVILEKDDGSQVAIPLDKLSVADQAAVARMMAEEASPFQPMKPSKRAASGDEQEDEPAVRKRTSKKSADAVDEEEDEVSTRPARKKAADDEEQEAEAGGEPKLVAPKWSSAREISPPLGSGKWSLSIEPPEQPTVPKKGRIIAVPPPASSSERAQGFVVNPVCRRAVLGYVSEAFGIPMPVIPPSLGARGRNPRTTRPGRVAPAGDYTRLVLCDLDAGKVLGAGAAPVKMVPMALSDSGDEVLMRSSDRSGGKKDLLELWALTRSGISRELQWTPHDDASGSARDIHWASYIDEERFVTASRGGMLTVWKAASARPLYYVKTKGLGDCHPALSPDRKYLAYASGNQVCVLDLTSGKIAATQPAPKVEFPSPAFAFTPKGTRLLCGARDRIYVWDVETGALYREISLIGSEGIHFRESMFCPSEEHLFLNSPVKSVLLDLESQLKLWSYHGQDFAAPLGAVCWFSVPGHNGPGALVGTALPQAAIHEQIQKALEGPDLFILKPGTTVKLNVAGIADAAEREKVAAVLTRKLEANGCQVGPNGSIEMAASTVAGKRGDLTYIISGRGSQTAPFQECLSQLKLVWQGKTLWEAGRSNHPGNTLLLNANESLEQHLRANQAPNYEFFSTVELPKMIQKPTEGDGTLGASEVSTAGLR